ncbi:amylo-alpha-1,6-glucosidase [uncultured Aquabacterium sp.]|uniref:amylo-alpha-1,6-glucosidase n=1 Tax=uncultured Aquabacterium sp. TaxID=158753 RepID=UPI002610DAE8|nr:amylo-alpha-1,6-glucosidase [uncultured Aquabacterium sp.]
MNLQPIEIDWHPGDDVSALRDREWLVTNGLGGFASGSLLGINTRRHHGLFVPNLSNPKGRHILISRFDEEIQARGRQVKIGGAEYLNGHLDTDVHRCLASFRWDHLMPTWRYDINGVVIEKTIVMPHNQNTVCVLYRLLEGEHVELRLRPFLAFRRQDAVLVHEEEWPFTLSFSRGVYEVRRDRTDLALQFGLTPASGGFTCHEVVGQHALYRVEQMRGYDHSEHLYSPGYFSATLHPGQPLTFVATAEGREALKCDGMAAVEHQQRRVERLLQMAPPAVVLDPVAAQLTAAADAFIVVPGSRLEEALHARASGDQIRTVIAGYHWFGDWGRDTMISLEGLTLCTGRHAEARAILQTFSHYVRDGLLPNLFPEGEREALYHTVDATLWYFHAIDRYTTCSGDRTLMHELFPVLKQIIEHHVRGTRYGIGLDPQDGLLRAGAPGYQLTWMDAKVDGWVVTPRRGKPVEIQALWHNALRLMVDWSVEVDDPDPRCLRLAEQARASFNRRYWSPTLLHLFDVVDGEAGEEVNDVACRPNQVFVMSLRHPVLDRVHWEPVLDTVRRQLLTPWGLRTLAPGHPAYKPTYEGDLRSRDAAYHQGTVWPWLIGHFIQAWLKLHPDRTAARAFLADLPAHLSEAGIGSISEIFDAEPPGLPRGCVAQAWSVAEVLRAWLMTAPAVPSDAAD